MNERPILFSGEMVRAILEGRKTMTRRVVKPQPVAKHWLTRASSPAVIEENGHYYASYGEDTSSHDSPYELMKYPYGQPGDRLWVKEAVVTHASIPQVVGYVADGCAKTEHWEKLRNPRFMPRWASRITLEVVSVKVERLEDISEHDARAEGIYGYPSGAYQGASVAMYRELWDSLYTKEPDKQWDANPWVWVIEFKRVSQ